MISCQNSSDVVDGSVPHILQTKLKEFENFWKNIETWEIHFEVEHGYYRGDFNDAWYYLRTQTSDWLEIEIQPIWIFSFFYQ